MKSDKNLWAKVMMVVLLGVMLIVIPKLLKEAKATEDVQEAPEQQVPAENELPVEYVKFLEWAKGNLPSLGSTRSNFSKVYDKAVSVEDRQGKQLLKYELRRGDWKVDISVVFGGTQAVQVLYRRIGAKWTYGEVLRLLAAGGDDVKQWRKIHKTRYERANGDVAFVNDREVTIFTGKFRGELDTMERALGGRSDREADKRAMP
ncbi:hypothetical protein BVY04_01410 [bacterium M21]|nr:hypothetical protein BVY04_01410 [bacterium M21]